MPHAENGSVTAPTVNGEKPASQFINALYSSSITLPLHSPALLLNPNPNPNPNPKPPPPHTPPYTDKVNLTISNSST
ncbi:MAG: hypothetical protein Q9214_004543 [Letrouitia sp. 1 TL-2023]